MERTPCLNPEEEKEERMKGKERGGKMPMGSTGGLDTVGPKKRKPCWLGISLGRRQLK